jgi:hypothetical protein
MVGFPFSRAVALLALCAVAAWAHAQSEANGTILPFKKVRTAAAVKESTRKFQPQINIVYKLQEEEAAENLPPPIEIKPPSEGNTLPVGSVGNYSSGAPGVLFPGISATGWNPPDPHIAVGPGHIVEIVNMSIAFYNKDTGQQTFQQLINGPGSFFSSIGAGNFVFDPKAFFDPVSQRFIVLALDKTDSGTTKISKLAIGISDDSNPDGTWYKYLIESKIDLGATSKYWMDYPSFASTNNALIVCGNMFAFSGSSGFAGAQFIVMDKGPMLSGLPTTSWSLRDAGGSSAQISQTTDPNLDRMYGAAASSTNSLKMYAITNLTTSPVLTFTNTAVPTFTPRSRDAQSTGGRNLWTIDSRLFNAVWRNGKFYTTHHVAVSSSDSRHMVRWYEISTNGWPTSSQNPATTQSGNIIGGADHDLIFPGINVNKFGDIAFVFTRCSPSITGDMMVTSRRSWDATGTVAAPMKLMSGINPNYSATRWGDYFSTQVDPVDDATFWGVSMISNAAGSWTTQILSWQTTTDLGTAYYPLTLSRALGASNSGTVEDGRISDNGYFQVASTPVHDGHRATTDITFQLDRPVTQLGALRLKLEASALDGISGSLFLFDWTTGTYQDVLNLILKSADKTFVATAPGVAARFVSPTGEVRASFRSIGSPKFGTTTPFNQKTDQILLFAGWN